MSKSPLLLLAIALVWPAQLPAASATVQGPFTPVSGDEGARRDQVLGRLDRKPYPATGDWSYVSQAFGAYWTGDNATGDKALLGLRAAETDQMLSQPQAAEKESFHWSVYQLGRLVLLFGREGIYFPGRMSPAAETAVKEMLWSWLHPRALAVLVDPQKDWWQWGSENHHLQAWTSMWISLRIFAQDPDYRNKTFTDGSTVPALKKGFDDYFKRFIRHRATRGLWVECGSPTYAKYSISGFYNLVDFSDDPELSRLAHEFLDLTWAQWALEQIDGVRAGSRHRSYRGESSISEGSLDGMGWYPFGVGQKMDLNPAMLCLVTSSYMAPALVTQIAQHRADLGSYEITSRQPGRADLSVPLSVNYENNPQWPMFESQGITKFDPLCRSMLRQTYATPDFILGTTMVPSLPTEDWGATSSQNRWDGVVFSGTDSARIFLQPQTTSHASIYNAQWSVQEKGVLILQRLPAKNAMAPSVFFSKSLPRTESDGWIFVEAPAAYAALKVVDGGWKWSPDLGSYHHNSTSDAPSGLGDWLEMNNQFSPLIMEVAPRSVYPSFAAFQSAIKANHLHVTTDRLDYTSALYQTTLSFFARSKQTPQIDGHPVNYEPPDAFSGPMLQGDFAGQKVTLHAFGQEHVFNFQ